MHKSNLKFPNCLKEPVKNFKALDFRAKSRIDFVTKDVAGRKVLLTTGEVKF